MNGDTGTRPSSTPEAPENSTATIPASSSVAAADDGSAARGWSTSALRERSRVAGVMSSVVCRLSAVV